jgi:hypothetical protein
VAESLVHKLIPLHEDHRQDIARVRDQIWGLYVDLKAYKAHPTADAKAQLEQRFDTLFTQKTRFFTLNQTLKRIYRNKAELLLVLERPEVPLHTHGSETVELAWSWLRYQPNSELSRWFRERFAHGGKRQRRIGIVALARRLLVAFWRYLQRGLAPQGVMLTAAAR